MKVKYQNKCFRPETLEMIQSANRIMTEYAAQGFDLTLRQLYYQFVARALFENRKENYNKLGKVISNGRLAGLIDWKHITDRTRKLRANQHWTGPAHIVRQSAEWFQLDKWADQSNRVEVWIEKDALVGILEAVCPSLDCPYFSCRGYTSQSEMRAAGIRMKRYLKNGQTPVVLHLGDHDPSGIDMSRDIQDRLRMFMGGVKFERLALNMDQIRQHNPPPNPAKLSDSRAASYIVQYGRESWELDALDPNTLTGLILSAVERYRDNAKWNAALAREQSAKNKLKEIASGLDR